MISYLMSIGKPWSEPSRHPTIAVHIPTNPEPGAVTVARISFYGAGTAEQARKLYNACVEVADEVGGTLGHKQPWAVVCSKTPEKRQERLSDHISLPMFCMTKESLDDLRRSFVSKRTWAEDSFGTEFIVGAVSKPIPFF